MSHSSGIPVSDQLKDAWGAARTEGQVRFLKITIQEDKLVLSGQHPLSADIEADYHAAEAQLQPKTPCYIVFRLDSKNVTGYEWLLLVYIPDGSSVKDRMIYASTREILKKQLGTPYFGDELPGSSPADLSLASYRHHVLGKRLGNSDAPLTFAEVQASQERGMEVAQGGSREYVHSVQFPFAPAADAALQGFAAGRLQLVQLALAAAAETIELQEEAAAVPVAALAGRVCATEPRFTLYRFDHQRSNAPASAAIFIYSCPQASKVKQKMLYSTVKSAVTAACEKAGVKLEKRLEVEDPAGELSEARLLDELYGPKKEAAATFDKPRAPGRGAPRLIRKGIPAP